MKKGNGGDHFSAAYSLETNEQTREHYSSWARTYDQEVGEENAYAQPARVVEMLGRYLEVPGGKILDAGCGSGLSGEALKDAGYTQIDGCDFSPEMLEVAREKKSVTIVSLLPTSTMGNPKFQTAFMRLLPALGYSPLATCFLMLAMIYCACSSRMAI